MNALNQPKNDNYRLPENCQIGDRAVDGFLPRDREGTRVSITLAPDPHGPPVLFYFEFRDGHWVRVA